MGSGCTPCDNNSPNSYVPPINTNNCNGGCDNIDSSCVIYTGPNLVCLEQNTNTSVQTIIQAIDAKVCSATGDWSGFNYHCLSDDYVITNPETFVNAITEEFCTLKSAYNTFTTSTYTTQISNLQTQITNIVNPNLTFCAGTGILSSDGYTTILTKLANNICTLQASQNVSSANWNQCFVTSPLPTTIVGGFNTLINQICSLQAEIDNQVVLPTFNNQGSCLAIQGTADTLAATVTAIKNRVCQVPTFNIDSASWGCITNPALGTGANIQAAFNAVLSATNTLVTQATTFDNTYFTTSYNTIGQPCSGTFVTLNAESIGATDRLVAASPSDLDPATLIEKLVSGSGNVTIDDTTNPGQVTIIVDEPTDELVKVNGVDPTAGYLADKVNGISNATKGISISTPTNGTTHKIDFTPDIDSTLFVPWLINEVQNNPTLYNLWCNLNCGCAPCGGSSTTTTTTTSAPATLRMYFENQSTTEDININIVLNQNSPTVGFINNGFNIAANGATATGYYNLTTPINPKTVSLTVSNPDFGAKNYDVNIEVRQGSSGPLVPGSTAYSTTALNSYSNSTFNIGSLSGDIVIKITVSNVVLP